ncbi:hypothetical protein TWF730_003970 [Orbilia blumenaviensis]|uniref:F-box domain-containing protein n=1 Tax=Orbilia blumenaviensis TaxID=1796055 RepID=A0AAV9U1D6_9PEZI
MPKFDIIRHVVPPISLGSLPGPLIERLLSYLPMSSVAALCQLYPAVLRIVCEHNKLRYFGYRKHQADTFMAAILYSAYERLDEEGVEEHCTGAKELANIICTELGKTRC